MSASASGSPSPRFGAVMFYDSVNRRVLLFGGASGGSEGYDYYNDMWSYDYAADSWVGVRTTGTPSGRFEQPTVYDPDTRRLITYGEGQGDTGLHMWVFSVVDDTWAQLASASLPSPPRASTPLVYDERYDKIIMFSGMSMEATADRFPEDTWVYDSGLNRWELMSPDASPEGHYGHSFVYDPVNERTLMMGGHRWTSGNQRDDSVSRGLWSYDYGSDSWTLIDDTQVPTMRHYHASAVNTDTGEFVVFGGGIFGENMHDDTWIWGDGGWVQVTSEPHPSARALATMTYDPVNKVILLFGGMDEQTNYLGDLWALDSEGHWTQLRGVGEAEPIGDTTEPVEQTGSSGIPSYPAEAVTLALLISTRIFGRRRWAES